MVAAMVEVAVVGPVAAMVEVAVVGPVAAMAVAVAA